MRDRNSARYGVALLVMAASGFAGLGYQIVWTQQGALWLGHEAAAVLAVVAAFFGGLALGALLVGERIARSRRPGLWYAVCEAMIGAWSLALAAFISPATQWLLEVIGAQPSPGWHWSVAFTGTFLMLLPATAAMGATLPAIERFLSRIDERRSSIAALYASNTMGAVVGVLATAFWLVPHLGLTRTSMVCAALNLACAAAAVVVFGEVTRGETVAKMAHSRRAVGLLAATGLLGIGYEVVVIRVLSQVMENTVYTFAILLAVYLLGTAIGAASYDRVASSHAPAATKDKLLRWLCVACLLGIACLAFESSLEATAVATLGGSMAAALIAEAAIAAAAFFLPTVLMGALFAHLCTVARAGGVGFGAALAANTIGAATAPLLFGLLLLPAFGAKVTLLAIAAAYLVLSSSRTWLTRAQWAVALAAAACAVVTPTLAIVDVPAGGRIASYTEGAMAAVSVVEGANGIASLHINNRQQEGSSGTLYADARQALLPILLHPGPRRALFLGLGTGVTAASATQDPLLDVEAVELLPEVIAASARFTREIDASIDHARLHLKAADARRFVRATRERYDVIVSDNFHPARSGSAALYTVEHFDAVRDRLASDGIFCQWLPLHQLDLDTLRSIVATFLAVFPDGRAVLATNSLDTPVVGLIASQNGRPFEPARIRARLEGPIATVAARFAFDDELALLGSVIAGPKALARFAGDAELNTDDHPIVAYRAPQIAYAADSLPRDRLVALLRSVEATPEEIVTGENAAWMSRLAAYWSARKRFIEIGRSVAPTSDAHRMLAQVREPLLAVLRTSPDFRPAYDPLLRMAESLARTDPSYARLILADLAARQPARPEASRLLRALDGPLP